MSERVQTCFLRRSHQNEILEQQKHSICTSHTSLITVSTVYQQIFMCAGGEEGAVTAKDHCSGLCFNICERETTAVTWCFWWEVCCNISGNNPDIFKETSGQFPAVLVQTKPENIFQLFVSAKLDIFDQTTGHFMMFLTHVLTYLTDIFDEKCGCFAAVLVITSQLIPAVFRCNRTRWTTTWSFPQLSGSCA